MTSRNAHKMFVRKLIERDHLGNLGQFENDIKTDLSDLTVISFKTYSTDI